MDKPRIKAPTQVRKGEPFEVKVLIAHDMESGQRADESRGERIPRLIINRFTCTLDGEEVFSVTLHPAVSANPYLSFYVVAESSGELEFTWTDDSGDRATARHAFEVQ